MAVDRLVVVGASLAGIRAIEAARKAGHTGSITLVGAERYLPYDRPPLSKEYLDEPKTDAEGGRDTADPDVGERAVPHFRTEEYLRDELDVQLRLATRASGLDPHARKLSTDGGELDYDALIIATGAEARTLPGAEGLAGVHTLRTVDDAEEIRAGLNAGARTVVVGAGFIGSEVASAARKRDLPVTVLEALPVPLVRSVGEQMGRACFDLHRANGTDLRCGVAVASLESAEGRVTGVFTDAGERIDADMVVVGTGVRPSTGWLEGSGITLHERDGGIVCDRTLNTGQPGVYAAGDVAHWPHPLFDGKYLRLEHWTNAAEQGALAARNALDPAAAKDSATVPYFWSDLYDSKVQFVGIPDCDEIRVVSEETGDPRFLALYRRGDVLGGTICIDRPSQIMKYRKMIGKQAPWDEALDYAGVGPA